MKVEIGHVVATRELWIQRGKAPKRVVVTMGEPKQTSAIEYLCPFAIDGLKAGPHRMAAAGVDAIHALQLAQVAIHAHLTNSVEFKEGRLYWLEPGDGVGFPGTPRAATGSQKRKRHSARKTV